MIAQEYSYKVYLVLIMDMLVLNSVCNNNVKYLRYDLILRKLYIY